MRRASLALAYFLAAFVALAFLVLPVLAIFVHVSPGRLIRNTQGGHLYYLVWAGPNGMGLKGAQHIHSKGDKMSAAKSPKGK